MAMFFEQKITSVLCRVSSANESEKLQSFLMFDFWYRSNVRKLANAKSLTSEVSDSFQKVCPRKQQLESWGKLGK